MTGTKILGALVLALLLLGCGSHEESSAAAVPEPGATKGAPVTKPSAERMDVGSEQQVANEEKGG